MKDVLYNFLIFASGADREILDLEECHSDRGKYASVGATVLLTGVFAFISGSYALHRVFINSEYSVPIALTVGAVWGVTIFNLDRLMVSTIRKTQRFSVQLLTAIPRLALAVIISIVVAKPLEVRIFSDRIESEINVMMQEAVVQGKAGWIDYYNPERYKAEAEAADKQITTITRRLNSDPDTEAYRDLIARREAAVQENARLLGERTQVQREINRFVADTTRDVPSRLYGIRASLDRELGSNGETRRDIDIAIEREVKRHQDEMRALIAGQQRALATADSTHQAAQAALDEQTGKTEEAAGLAFSANFVTQLEALGRLTSGSGGGTVMWTSWMIMLLFLLLETSPILVKLMSRRGPYDEVLHTCEVSAAEAQDDYKAILRQMSLDRAKRAETHAAAMEKHLYSEIADAQMALQREAVANWAKQQKSKLNTEAKKPRFMLPDDIPIDDVSTSAPGSFPLPGDGALGSSGPPLSPLDLTAKSPASSPNPIGAGSPDRPTPEA